MQSPPAWSIGRSHRGFDWKSGAAPGPGSYNPQKNRSGAPSWKLGTSSRVGDRRNDAPGPGAYNSPGKISTSSPKYPFGVKSPRGTVDNIPGPGTYEGTGRRGYDTTAPAYTIRQRAASTDGKTKAPGPGAYEPTSKIQNQTSPSFKIGTGNRDDFYPTSTAPGPGAYTTRPNSASGPKFAFGTSERDPLYGMSKTLPGPGQYDFKGEFESPGKGTTLVPRRPDSALATASRSPGPGAYNPSLSTKEHAPSYRMGSAPRDEGKGRSGAPGPGNYDPNPVKGNQNVKIGTSVRSPLSLSQRTPGPGTYEFDTTVGAGPQFTMNPRRGEKDNRFAPGPGAYDQTSRIQNQTSPSFKMGSAKRDDFYPNGAAPGPGSYTTRPDSASGPKFGFGTSERDPLYGMSKTLPGPGQYDFRGEFESPGKGTTLVPRRPDSALATASRSPGPGAYNPNLSTKEAAPSYRMGSAPRDDGKGRSGAPGPGNYDPREPKGNQNVKIGTSVRSPLSLSERTPGPGSYEFGTKVGEGPLFTMNPRRGEKDNRFAPGPGAYDQTSRIQSQTSPSFKMGSSKRDDLYRSGAAPGPGAYTTRPNSASGPKFGFGTADRDNLNGMSKTLPGPGSYDSRGMFSGQPSQGKGVSMTPRRPDSALVSASRSPGPGAYDPSLSTKGQAPAYRMGSASRDGSRERSGAPGPGNYDPKQWKGNQNIKIGTSVRSPLSLSARTPGPGSYESTSRVGEGPKFFMNPRREQKDTRYAPGPGAYNPSVEYVKDHNPTVRMGSGKRDELSPQKANPGPGQYDVRGDIAGPRWGFGSELRGQDMRAGGPGPGSYNIPHQVGDVPKYAYGSAPLKIHL